MAAPVRTCTSAFVHNEASVHKRAPSGHQTHFGFEAEPLFQNLQHFSMQAERIKLSLNMPGTIKGNHPVAICMCRLRTDTQDREEMHLVVVNSRKLSAITALSMLLVVDGVMEYGQKIKKQNKKT